MQHTKDGKTVDLSFNVLDLLSRERTTFGLRSSTTTTGSSGKDYTRYRHHCSNKIHRLRQVTGMKCGGEGKGKGKKEAFEGVKRLEVGEVRDVSPNTSISLTSPSLHLAFSYFPISSSPSLYRQLQLLLFLSERSFAHSQSLLSQLTKSQTALSSNKPIEEGIGSIKALKKEMLSKLRKAEGWGRELEDLVKGLMDGNSIEGEGKKDQDEDSMDVDKAENINDSSSSNRRANVTISYQTRLLLLSHRLLLSSSLHFHKSQHDQALPLLTLRHHLLSHLSKPENCKSSYEQALLIEEMDGGEGMIRFSAYKLGRKDVSGGGGVDAIVGEFDDEAREEILPGYGELLAEYDKEVQTRDELESTPGTGRDGKGGSKGGKKGTLEPIFFADEPLSIRSASLVDSMIKVQMAIQTLEGEKVGKKSKMGMSGNGNGKEMKAWDGVLAALGEAEEVARRGAEEEGTTASSSRRLNASGPQSSPTFIHQYISHLLLSYRIKRDLLLTTTLGDPLRRTSATTLVTPPSTASTAKFKSAAKSGNKSKPIHKSSLPRHKKQEALKTINALVKLYESVLQGLGQMREFGIVEERDEVRRGVEGMERYFRSIRCIKLAQMYLLLPTMDSSSALHLSTQASTYLSESRSVFGYDDISEDDEFTLQENFYPISLEKDILPLEQQVKDIENATKRALYTELNGKPVFYDLAFNYIDLPMEELEVLAGKTPAPAPAPASITSTIAQTAKAAIDTASNVAMEGVESATAIVAPASSRARESTPGPEETDSSRSKGWFGGLWGGKK